MADDRDLLSQSYYLVYNFLVKGFIALLVLSIATLLTKTFGSQDNAYKSGSDDSNFCSSSECLRCTIKYNTTPKAVLSKMDVFWGIRRDRTGLERLYKATERYDTEKRQNDPVCTQKPTVFYVHGLSCQPWYEETYLEQLKPLKSLVNYELIKSEFKRMRLNASEGWFKNTTPEGEWLVFHLFNQGEKVEENCTMCPNTMEIIESIEPFMKGCSFGNALFSVVTPGTHITEHYGPTNCRIRCHLPLLVPQGCSLCVNGEEKEWKEKELLLFDDSFLHEAWHIGMDGERVVLMLDLWHPELTVVEKEALTYMFSGMSKFAR